MALSKRQREQIREFARQRVKAGDFRKFVLPKKSKKPSINTPPAKPKS
jgi:hypothetical protein